MKKAGIIIGLFFGLFVGMSSAATLLEDDFEDGDTSDWLTFATAQIDATSDFKHNGSFGGQFINSTMTCEYVSIGLSPPAYKKFSPQTGIFTIEFYGLSYGSYITDWRRFGFSDRLPEVEPNDQCIRLDPIDSYAHYVGGVLYGSNDEFRAIVPEEMIG